MKPNKASLNRMNKNELQWLVSNRCSKHGHRYISHFGCFLKEQHIEEKIAYLDTEFYVGKNRWGKLAGDWGFFFCWVIGDGKGHYKKDVIKPSEVKTTRDKRIVKSCITELKKYDRVIHQYGDRADIPLLRTRALINKIPFFKHGELYTTDVWKIAKDKLTLSSNSQGSIAEALYGETEKTRVRASIWLAALQGNQKAFKEILKHCEADVRDLERNAEKLLPFIRLTKRSI